MLVQLNILCLICINRQCPQNCIEFDYDAWVLLNFYSKYSKIRTISNAWLVQTKFNMSGQRVSVCRANAEGKKTFSRKALGLWFLSLFQNLVRRTLSLCSQMFKYCCENVLEQGLLPAIRRISNNDLMFKQDGVPYTPFTTLLLTCIHAFQCAWLHWTWKLAAEVQSTSIFRGLFSVDSVVVDSVMSQNFRHWSAEASSDQLLGSAEPGHTEPSDWSAAKKTEDGYQGKGWSCWILLVAFVRLVTRLTFL